MVWGRLMKTWADGWLLPDRQAYPQNGLLSITGRLSTAAS